MAQRKCSTQGCKGIVKTTGDRCEDCVVNRLSGYANNTYSRPRLPITSYSHTEVKDDKVSSVRREGNRNQKGK